MKLLGLYNSSTLVVLVGFCMVIFLCCGKQFHNKWFLLIAHKALKMTWYLVIN
jgi:hypothetical protein